MAATALPKSTSIVTLLSECTVFPECPTPPSLSKLTASDLPMLSVNYIQKGVLLPSPTCPAVSAVALLQLLKAALSRTLVHFPMLAGRLRTDSTGFVYVDCDDSGVPFVHAAAPSVMLGHVLEPNDVPAFVRQFFTLNHAVSYDGHFMPLAAVQVTVLADGVFIAATVNHAVADGTSFWNFFNTWAEISRGSNEVSRPPETHRFFIKDSAAVLRFEGMHSAPGKTLTPPTAALRERIFRFSRKAMLDLKGAANKGKLPKKELVEVEVMGKESNDFWKKAKFYNGQRATSVVSWPRRVSPTAEVSSFQSLCAQIWRSVTRARRLPSTKKTTFRMAVNCRHRLSPPLHPEYFGNAIQSIATAAEVGDLLKREIGWGAGLLHRGVVAHGDATIRGMVDEWEKAPRTFPLGNADGASITMGSSARFPMYDNDFGWGVPVAVRSGGANKFDGKMSAFPGRDGFGSVDVEMCLAPNTMALLERDPEFKQYVTAP